MQKYMKYITEMIFFFFFRHHITQLLCWDSYKPNSGPKTTFFWAGSTSCMRENKLYQQSLTPGQGDKHLLAEERKNRKKKKPQQKFHSLDRKIFSRCCGCRETGSSEKSHPPQSHTAAEITHRFHLLLLYCVTSLLQYFTSNSPSLVLLLFGLNLHTGLMSFKH